MNPFCRLTGVALCAFTSLSPVVAQFEQRSISTSGQFTVFSSDLVTRGTLCVLAEQAKNDLLRVIDQPDRWRFPIVVNAQSAQVNFPEMPRSILNLSQTGFGLKLQLDLKIGPDMTPARLRYEFINALLVEMIHRREPDLSAGKTYTQSPEWLLDALANQTTIKQPGSIATGIPSSFEELLGKRHRSLDPLNHELYRIYSSALLDQLIQLPNGRHRLALFIFDLSSASTDQWTHLRSHFPELSSQATHPLEVPLPFWRTDGLLTESESEKALDELLDRGIPCADSGEKYQLNHFAVFIRNPASRGGLTRLRSDLQSLGERSHPNYRPLIGEYERIVTLLVSKKTKGISKRLLSLDSARKRSAVRRQKIDDYMNWFEATQSSWPSGLFDHAANPDDLTNRADERRQDSMSTYLDLLDAEFEKESESLPAASKN